MKQVFSLQEDPRIYLIGMKVKRWGFIVGKAILRCGVG